MLVYPFCDDSGMLCVIRSLKFGQRWRRFHADAISPVSVLGKDIAAFERMRPELEASHARAWVVFHQGTYVATYPDFEAAAADAVERFDEGPYLIRQVGAPKAVQLPGGMIFTPSHAVNASRL
jgi:hypothetical protein